MQATYYRYYITKNGHSTRYKYDIRKFLSKFCSWKNPTFKSKFEYNGERLYLIHSAGDHFLFLHTLDNEIIKKIDLKQLTFDDLKEHLKDDSIGFASYVNIKDDYFGISCKILSPRGVVFSDFINMVFSAMNFDYEFHIIPLTHQMSRKDISELKRVGKIKFKLERENTLHEQIIEYFTGSTKQQYKNIGAIEIVIRPKERTGDIKSTLQSVSSRIGEDGVDNFEARAITAFSDKVMDVYLVGEGAIRSPISGDSDDKIQLDFDKKIATNALLKSKLDEMRINDALQNGTFSDIDNYSWPRA